MVYGFIRKQLKFIYKSFKVLILNHMLVKLKSYWIYTHFVSFSYTCYKKCVIQISCLDDQHDLYEVCKFGNCTIQNFVHCKVKKRQNSNSGFNKLLILLTNN